MSKTHVYDLKPGSGRLGRRVMSCLTAATLLFSVGVTPLSVYAEDTKKAEVLESGVQVELQADNTEPVMDDSNGKTEASTTESQPDADDVVEQATPEDSVASYNVASWTWVDTDGLLMEGEDGWGLGLAGVSTANPLTRGALAELLPAQITAVLDNNDEVTLDLTWDLTSIPEEGTAAGDYTATAALADETYVLGETAAPLTVTIQLGGAETYTKLPEGEAPYSDHIVNGVSPNGTTIDLFDYWVTANQTDADNNSLNGANEEQAKALINGGINNNHALIFGNGLADYNNKNGAQAFGSWNTWTGDDSPKTGIVQNELGEDGYPVLNLEDSDISDTTLMGGRDGKESLDYLFDPDEKVAGKESYEDVQGLLQVDENGYYYYDSNKNYAVYYKDTNSFTVYDSPGVQPDGKSSVGQFFPFNEADSANTVDGQYLMNTVGSTDSSINHYFGVHMSTRFIQQNGGYTDDTKKTPVTYEFSGDDDVWIFIDGVLVADLGGIHNAASVSIDFVTGEITINGTVQAQTLGEILGTNSDTLTDNTYHTLDFFYLERGNVDSNMNLKYNLVTIPESNLIKVDQLGNPVQGAEFTLYAADEYKEKGTSATAIATGTTDRDGEFVFLDEQDMPITLENLYNTYKDRTDGQGNNLVLVETDTPAGYRTGDTIGLYFYESAAGEVLLLSNSTWSEGAYAMPKVTATTPNVIRAANDSDKKVTLTGAGAVTDPLMFAVVFQKQEGGQWFPVYGDPIGGWTVATDASWGSILEAAKQNPYIFQLASSGAYQVEIDNLPGDIKTYYHITQDENTAEYTIGYYYSTATRLEDATADNSWRIDSDPADGQDQYALDRVFSMDLYVTNIQNRLLVQKVDENGNAVNGAEFSLYEAQAVSVAADGSVTIPDNAQVYDSLTTSDVTDPLKLDGGGVFPTNGKVLENGEYYLVETSAPGGYRLNDTVIHVIVDDTGVYADAGTANDGVTVLRGVGSVMRSMVQFAADDQVDTTLNGIKAALATKVEYNGQYNADGSFTVSDANWDEDTGSVLHLQFANENSLLDYGLYDTSVSGTIDNLTLATEAGWSKLLIKQCYQHDETVDTSLKTDLRDMDITNLFSGTVTVRVADQRTGNLTIRKTVTGNNAPANQDFTFEVQVTENGTPVKGTYDTRNQRGESGTISFTNGTATVQLKKDESLTILGLTTGASFTVTEKATQGYAASVTVTGDQEAKVNGATVAGTIQHDTTDQNSVVLSYSNAFDGNAHIQLTGTKTLQGRNIQTTDTFTFVLSTYDEATEQAVTDGKITMPQELKAEVTGDGTAATADFTFGSITFTEEDNYQFAVKEELPQGITEANPVANHIRYDTHTAIVTVKVTKNATTGILEAVVTVDNADDNKETAKAAFVNVYTAPDTSTDTSDGDGQSTTSSTSTAANITAADDTAPASVSTIPQTGDTTNPMLWAVLCGAAFLGLLGVFVVKKRNMFKNQ